jgi:hypothetical protein
MKVVAIRSRMLFGEFYPRAESLVSEGAAFVACAVFALCAPALLFCYVIGQLLPFYLMACNGALGVLWGVYRFKQPSADGFVACVPVNHAPNASSSTYTRETAAA